MARKLKLLIVESPTKAKTLSRYLRGNFKVLASKGHVKDLPKSKLGVDIEGGFIPRYIILREKAKTLREIVKEALRSKEVYIGSDPDREGEAIAYHIAEEIKKRGEVPVKRVLFYEITKEEVKRAIDEPGEIDMKKVEAQQARRILDRLVGYKVSPILWRVLKKGLSAGRVQTVALRLICERERKIEAFKEEKYYEIEAIFEKDGKKFRGTLEEIGGEKKRKFEKKQEAEKILERIKDEIFKVKKFKEEIKKAPSPPPFKTSTLQQEASSRLGFPAKKTMQLAQELYEGVEIDGERKGLITYMRTDSVRIAEKALKALRGYIREEIGETYLPRNPKLHKDKGKVQGAHEAIRPTYIGETPEKLRGKLRPDLLKLYELIWRRAVASQMEDAKYLAREALIDAAGHTFKATGKEIYFDGFLKIWPQREREVSIPSLQEGEVVQLVKLDIVEKKTEPPRRYTEATLVKELESKGIGRPSTYAPTISTLFERNYIERVGRFLKPTELGLLVNDLLIPRFPELFDVGFTAKMEENLDKVEEGTLSWRELLRDFYKDFEKELQKVEENIEEIKKESQEITDLKCPVCGKPLIVKWGRYGKFLSCSGYPDCTYTRPINEEITEEKCPICGSPMVVREGRTGRYLVCINYPKCKGTRPYKIGVKCPECGGDIIERRNRKGQIFYACSNYPKCKFTLSSKPVPLKCPECGYPLMVEKWVRSRKIIICPKCGRKLKESEFRKLSKELHLNSRRILSTTE